MIYEHQKTRLKALEDKALQGDRESVERLVQLVRFAFRAIEVAWTQSHKTRLFQDQIPAKAWLEFRHSIEEALQDALD